VKAAECQSESGNSIGHHEIAGKFVEAANCFKKISPVDAIRTFERAIDLYNENGKFGTSARS
jgi:alpha-soluble NSF attachment protein